MREEHIKNCLSSFEAERNRFNLFKENVKTFFANNEKLNQSPFPVVHSIKARVKDMSHLEDKLNRKWDDRIEVTVDNLFQIITDLAGVRVLHLHHDQFISIHNEINENINKYKEWVLVEQPKAYIWDKEKEPFYRGLGLDVHTKDSNYTSIHYVIKPNSDSIYTCEIQVRTLFEEIWGEIDHNINYPHPTDSVACKEQIKVLAKLVNAGTRLADSIYASLHDHTSRGK